MAFRRTLAMFRQMLNISPMIALPQKTLFPQIMTVRNFGHLLPKSQYDTPINKDKLGIPRVMTKYWETIPLFVTTGTALTVMFSSILWAIKNKVDVVFTTHNRRNISKTMDLRNPTVHKIFIINQKYKPWPELQATIDKMNEEECKRMLKAQPVK